METALGIVRLVFGLVGVLGQGILVVSWSTAQRFGLQEQDDHVEPLFKSLEWNTALWDLFTLWTFPAAGVLLLTGHPLWPAMGLIAGGVHFDVAGRESAKLAGLRKHGIKAGSDKDFRVAVVLFTAMAGLALWLVVASFLALADCW